MPPITFSGPKAGVIYIFRINDELHADCLKIGEASMSDVNDLLQSQPNSKRLNEIARKRIEQYTKTAAIPYELLHTESTIMMRNRCLDSFHDTRVHEILLRSGIRRKEFAFDAPQGREWFVTDLATAIKAIQAAREGRDSLDPSQISHGRDPIVFRPEQRDAINRTKQRFAKNKQMLWNAKMRFGKTLTAQQVVKEMGFKRTLILTHRPVVDQEWFEAFGKIFYDSPHYRYGSANNGESFTQLEQQARKEKDACYVYFASMQDLRGSESVGGKFDKNQDLFDTPWNLVIVDEAHEGTKTELGQSVLKSLIKKHTRVLHLSGTPFNLMDDFEEEEIFTWDYIMEQRAKQEWEATHFGDPNPYACLPRLNIFTYELGKVLRDYQDETIAFNFREFFRTDEQGRFVHERDVIKFLDLLVENTPDSNYPFACEQFRSIFRHTLWVLPGVRAARALSALLQQHPVFGQFRIANVAGEGDEDVPAEDALKLVRDAMGDNPGETYSITLSCGRLTTGVSVPEWFGVLMLAGSVNTDAKRYMQTIFRVQTPATINGLRKEDCYAFDFAPDRTLQVLATVPRVSTKAGTTTESQKRDLQEFLNFCPVIASTGSSMKTLDANRMLEALKKADVERVVRNGFEDSRLYNDELLKLREVDVQEFDKLKGIIGQTKAIGNTGTIDINNQGLTGEEYKEQQRLEKKPKKQLTEEEKKRLEELKKKKKLKEDAISILRGISIRMPLLIFGADIKDEDTELSIDNFTSLIDPKSWEEFMPAGVTKALFNRFRKYYDDDIFRAAGKRIRSMLRAADKLTIEDRIERIAYIFATLHNPDKETILTPWRIVNLHMGQTIGGYCFYDEKFEHLLPEPRFIDNGRITSNIFDCSSRILEINSKTGLYALYLAYSLYRERLHQMLIQPEDNKSKLAIWDEVIEKNIYVICKAPMAKQIALRTLLGFRKGRTNLRYFENLSTQIINKKEELIDRIIDSNAFGQHLTYEKNMKFSAVVGNPPYQEVVAKKETQNGQKCSSNIFHHFQMVSEKVGRYTSLIYPGIRWIHRSGKGLEKFGAAQINDPHLSRLIFYPDANEIFKEVAIADGISIVVKDAWKTEPGFNYIYMKNGRKTEIFSANPGNRMFHLNPLDAEVSARLEEAVTHFDCLHNSVHSRTLFGIESDFVEKNPQLVRAYDKDSDFDPTTEIKLLTNDKSGKSGRARWYIVNRDVIKNGIDYLDKWKVIVSSANAGGQKRDNQIAVIDNHSAFGRSRVALKIFETEKEARNFLKYATSEVIRFAFLLTDENLSSLAKKVPDLRDYCDDNKLIDYDKDVNDQLYDLFHIDKENRKYIQDTLRHRNK